MAKQVRFLYLIILTLLVTCRCSERKTPDNTNYIPPQDLIYTIAQDTNFKSILAIRDTSKLTQQQREYRTIAERTFQKYFVIKNNRMILDISLSEFKKLGLYEEDYNMLKKSLVNSNRFMDSLGITNLLKSFNGQPYRDIFPEKDTLFGAEPFNPKDSLYWYENIK